MTQPRIAYAAAEYRPIEQHLYPIDNVLSFEAWFYQNYVIETDTVDRFYFPIFWTAYLKNHSYGEDRQAIDMLQVAVNKLDKKKKYYTIVQFDNGPMVDFSGLDMKVFSMAGEPMDYTLPLICQPHAYAYPNEKRSIFCSFVGRITHSLREQLLGAVSKVRNDNKEYYVSTYPHPMNEYCRILAKSVFSLCPRGYSANSFRIMESMQYGAIPVWVSDKFLIPHGFTEQNFEEYGVLIRPDEIYRIDKILNEISDMEIERKQANLNVYYQKAYTFEVNKKLIIENLKNELAG